MATIVKTASGTWKALVRRRGWPQQIRTFQLKRDAEAWAREIERDMARGSFRPSPPRSKMLTVGDALDRYLATVTPTKRRGTQAAERTAAKRLRESLGRCYLPTLTPAEVAAYRDKRLASITRRGEPVSLSTVRLELILLGHLYRVARREWGFAGLLNPLDDVRKPAAAPGRQRRLVGDEEARLLAACDAHSNPMLGWIVRLALATAMRKDEIRTLAADQVDLDRRVIRLSMTKNGSARTVPLSTAAVDVLRQALAWPLRLETGSPLVFPGEPGRDGQRRPYMLKKAWQDAVRRAGITGLRFHDLRHEATSRLIELGLSAQEASAISGHKSMQMLKRCTHLRAEDLAAKLG
ncbi:MAG: site-specific integrase [Gammaproteobacteria bacterium]|nr:site-specific integrase [Gammaproteobacteria bacterium]